jgi:pantoate--beta-alanine ligase
MKIIRTSVDLNHWFNEHNIQNNKSLGLVPTMGALHQGHASLIEKASKDCDFAVVSILVNPTQFNKKNDLDAYPRTMDADAKIAKAAGCNVIFAPTAEDLYGGKPKAEHTDWGSLTHSFEGKCRPGHFDGVIAVVDKLFSAVKPNKAYFGAKDLQQVAVVQKTAQIRHPNIEIVSCDLIRDSKGLALSSRNIRLTDQGIKRALMLSYSLSNVVANISAGKAIKTAVDNARKELQESDGINLEYFNGVNYQTFSPEDEPFEWSHIVVAANVDGVRLIDNIELEVVG